MIPKKTDFIFDPDGLVRLLIWIILGVQMVLGQGQIDASSDSLQKLSYNRLYASYRNVSRDTIKSRLYLLAYLDKAIAEKDTIKMAKAYSHLSYYEVEESKKIALLDLAIHISKKQNHDKYPVKAYSFKGGYYFMKGDYQLALDNYIQALSLAEKVNNKEYVQYTNHNIACIKTKIDKHQEALLLFKENFVYERDRDELNMVSYLQSLIPMAESFRYNKQIDSASFYNYIGISKSLKTEKLKRKFYGKLVLNEGINLFFEKQYNQAYDSIIKGIALQNKYNSKDKESYVLGSFYLGQLYLKRRDTIKAEKEFLSMDSIVQKERITLSETRKGYEFLIGLSKFRVQREKQLVYINKLLRFDSIVNSQRTSVSTKLFKEFDTPLLLKEKKVLIKKLEKNTNTLSFWVGFLIVLFLMAITFMYYQYIKRKKYERKFKELLDEGKRTKELPKKPLGDIGIADDIVSDILEKLALFEERHKFLKKNISISSLAKEINTNTKYLSKIINHHKHKSFTNYVNELRVQYSVDQLKENSSLKNYTIQGIAEEMGFNSAESFSSAFKRNTGMKPSYFMRKLTALSIE
ncbi:AraC family transcriptional regulator [Aquimarina megaterium]|uniref:AraC family transcriptional regulator n=1 Tax=Aquimarina megaterium TaxID=1443666 RepID=UPI00046FAD7C|nr:AraC family transcriptional regulator [Aquimarina megaterium]